MQDVEAFYKKLYGGFNGAEDSYFKSKMITKAKERIILNGDLDSCT